mgnify:CR=1 FL=1
MTDTTNRVLSLDEVMALEEGARVWVEVADDQQEDWAGVHAVIPGEFLRVRLRDIMGAHFDPEGMPEQVGTVYRVWSLPQPPTAEELERWPWHKEGEASE